METNGNRKTRREGLERRTWKSIVAQLWLLNHMTFKGRASIEANEDLLTAIEECITRNGYRRLRSPTARRIKARNVMRIRRLERALFGIAGKELDHGRKLFGELNRVIEGFCRCRNSK